MNDLLKKHFTEEEFIELRDGKNIIEKSYIDGGSYAKNTIEKSLGRKKVFPWQFSSYKREYPGGPLIKIENDPRVVEDSIKLSHGNYHTEYVGPDKPFKVTEHLWILTINIDKTGETGTSGVIPFETDYSTGWTRISSSGGQDTYYGVGDTYGELKPLSKSIDNTKLIDNIQVGDVFIHLMKYHCLYIKEKQDDGVMPAKFKCEQWVFNSFQQGNSDIIPTPVLMCNPIHYYQDINMEELDILNMYTFLMKSKQGSTNLEDYFGYYGKK